MQATMQPQTVKSATANSAANLVQARPTARPASGSKTGTRFLGFLMSALGAWAV